MPAAVAVILSVQLWWLVVYFSCASSVTQALLVPRSMPKRTAFQALVPEVPKPSTNRATRIRVPPSALALVAIW